MDSDTKLAKNKDILQEVIMAITDLKKSKGVPAKEIINLIANRSDTLPDKKVIATKIRKAIVSGLKSGVLVKDNGLFSINKLTEIPLGINNDLPLTELRRRRGRRRRGRGKRRGRRRGRRHADNNQNLRVNVHNVVERLIKGLDEGSKKESYNEFPPDESESLGRDSLKDITELRRRRRRRSRGRRRRRQRSDITELRRRRRRRGGRKGRRRRRRSIDVPGEN